MAAISAWQRWQILDATPYPVGVDGYFYPIQVRSILEHGVLRYPASPVAFYWMAPFAAVTDPIVGAKLGAAIGCALIAVPAFGVGAKLGGSQRSVDATVRLADLTPYAAMDQVALQGALTLVLHAMMQGDTTTLNATGTVGVTGGMEQARSLVGDNGRLQLAATLRGNDVSLSQLEFTGQAVSLTAKGSVATNQVALMPYW